MSQQTLWRRLLKRPYVGINIERHARLRVTKTPSELDSQDTLLVPEGGTPVAQQMRMDAVDTAHRVSQRRAFNATQRLKGRNDPRLDWYPPAMIGLAHLWPDTDPLIDNVDVSIVHRYCFADAHASVFYEDDGEPITRVHCGEQGQDLVFIGRLWYHAQRLREANGIVAGWILWYAVEDHAGLTDVAGDSAGTQPVRDHLADPVDDVGGGQ